MIERLNAFFIDHPTGVIAGPVAAAVVVILRWLGVEALQDEVVLVVALLLNALTFGVSMLTPRVRPAEIVPLPQGDGTGPDPE